MKQIFLGAALCLATAAPAILAAQDMHVPSVTTANPGMLFPNDAPAREVEQRRLNRQAGRPDDWGLPGKGKSSAANRRGRQTACGFNALPAAERQRLNTEYGRHFIRSGRAAADAWAKQVGRSYRGKLPAC